MEQVNMTEIITATRDHPAPKDYQSSKFDRINYWTLGFTLFIAITCAILVSDLIRWQANRIYIQIVAAELQKKLEAKTKAATQRLDAQLKNIVTSSLEQKQIPETNTTKEESAAKIQRMKIENCQFWINEYKKRNLAVDKDQRNISCREAGINFN
jgi:hypothetical protein